MIIQLALDRLTISEAIRIAQLVEADIDWIEVGTSLIKEFGIDSVRQMRKAFPHKKSLLTRKQWIMRNMKQRLALLPGQISSQLWEQPQK